MADYDVVSVMGIANTEPWINMFTQAPGGLRGTFTGRSNNFAQLASGPSIAGRTTGTRRIGILCQLEEPFGTNYEKLVGLVFGSGLVDGCPDPANQKIAGELVYTVGGANRVLEIAPADIQPHAGNQAPDDCEESGWYTLFVDLASRIPYAELETPTGPDASPDVVPVVVKGSGPTPRVEYCLDVTTQKAATDGARFRSRFTVINRSGRDWVRRPVCVTFDHASQVPANSIINGNDVGLLQNGREIERDSGNWNDAATRVFGRISLPAAQWWEVQDYTVGATELFMCPAAGALPAVGQWLGVYDAGSGESEVLRVTARDAKKRSITVSRAQRDTTARANAADNRLWSVSPQGFLDLTWGKTNATAPACPFGDRAPIFDLAASDNTTWDYGNQYYEGISAGVVDVRKDRGGALVPKALGNYERERYRGDGNQFWRYIAQDLGMPATAFGLEYRQAGPVDGRDIYDRWDFDSPVGIQQYDYSWAVVGLRYGLVGTPLKVARLSVHHVDGSGNDVTARQLDLDVTGGAGVVNEVVSSPVYNLSWRIDPFDRDLPPATAGSGSALEPSPTGTWTVDDLVITFWPTETPIICGNGSVQNIYQFGTRNDPAILATDLGQAAICGIVVPVGSALCLNALTGEVTDGEQGLAHLVNGRVPLLPADLGAYPAAGSTDVTYTETNETGLEMRVAHRDVFPT